MNQDLAGTIWLRGILRGVALARAEIQGAAARALPFPAYQEGAAVLRAIADDPRTQGSLLVLEELINRGERDTALPADLRDSLAALDQGPVPDPDSGTQTPGKGGR